MKVVNAIIIKNKRVWSMRFECKKCGKDMSNNVMQVWINEFILSGRKYIHSDGTEAKYQEVTTNCGCSSQYKNEQV